MIEKIFLYVFLLCLFPCAALVLFFIWVGGPPTPMWFQSAATLFVVGLASFLFWFISVLLSIRRAIEQER